MIYLEYYLVFKQNPVSNFFSIDGCAIVGHRNAYIPCNLNNQNSLQIEDKSYFFAEAEI